MSRRKDLPPVPFTDEEIAAGIARDRESMKARRKQDEAEAMRKREDAAEAVRGIQHRQQPENNSTTLVTARPVMSNQLVPKSSATVSLAEIDRLVEKSVAENLYARSPEGMARAEYASQKNVYAQLNISEEEFVTSIIKDVADGRDSFGAGVFDAPAVDDAALKAEYQSQRKVYEQLNVLEADYVVSRRAELGLS